MNLVDEIKTILEIQDGSHDMFLDIMVPAIGEYVIELCNNPFTKDEYGDTVFPGPVKIFMAKAIEHNMGQAGLKGETMGTVSYSYDLEFPSTLERFLRPYKRLKFHAAR